MQMRAMNRLSPVPNTPLSPDAVPPPLNRSYSSEYSTSSVSSSTANYLPLLRNPNISWVTSPFIPSMYIILILAHHYLISKNLTNSFPMLLSKEYSGIAWTITNISHFAITTFFFHWIKGSSNYYDQGDLNGMTWFEQLSNSPDANVKKSYLKTRLIYLVPVVLTYLGCMSSSWNLVICSLNVIVGVICVGSKLNFMLGVRIWGINSTVGIDDVSVGGKSGSEKVE